jgi:putative ABC transport system permease protein
MVLRSDLRAAMKTLIAARGFTAVALITLAVSLALAVVVVTVVNAYVFRGMPYPAADRLYRVDYTPPGQLPPRELEDLDWSAVSDVVETTIAWDLDVFYMLGEQYPESMPGAWVTPGYLSGFGVRAALGRPFDAADFAPGSPAVALISHRVWQSRYGGRPDVVGTTFQAFVSDRPDEAELFTIVGVLVPDLWHVNAYTEVYAPLRAPSYPYVVRLQPGVTLDAATGRIARHVRDGVGAVALQLDVRLVSLHESYVASLRPLLWSVTAAVALVLLIALANVTVLSIVRGRKRERELAVRLALGASHVRVAGLLALEGVLLGVAATVAGLLLARGTLPLIAPLIETSLDRRVPGGLEALNIDIWVIAAALVSGMVVTVALAAVPLVTLRRSELSAGVVSSGRGTAGSRAGGRSRAVLIAVEVAASLTLLVGAALMVESALRMLQVEFGMRAEGVVTAGISLRQRTFPDAPSQVAFFDRLTMELEAATGDAGIAFGEYWPLQAPRPRRVETGGQDSVVANAGRFVVSSNYFETLGIPLRDGRGFGHEDRIGSEPVVIVSASLAQHLWPRTRAVGQRLIVHPDEGVPWTAVVIGVAADTRQSHTDGDFLDVYLPLSQHGSRFAFLYARPGSTPWPQAEVRLALARVNPEVALGALRPLQASLELERAQPQFMAYLLSTLAAFASVLALVGMHGVIAYAVRQREREIAVRIAIGADARAVTALFLRDGVLVLGGGLAAGVAGALALGRVLQSQLYGVQPAEPRVLAVVVMVFGVVALAAMLGPAWRASTTDPMLVLNAE